MSIRDEVAQFRTVARYEARQQTVLRRREVRRHLDLPATAHQPRQHGEVWAVTMVRDEADVLEPVLKHLLDQGVDRILVADNLSTDDTPRILADVAARDDRVLVAQDRLDAYYQDHKMTVLARAASRSGADWVIPFDADELWFAERGSVTEHLRALGNSPSLVGIVAAEMHDAIPTDSAGTWWDADLGVNATPVTLGKVAVRAHRTVRLGFGNHGAARAGVRASGLRIAHVAYRSREQLARKVRRGSHALALTDNHAVVGAHWRNLARMTDAEIAILWRELQDGIAHPEVPLNVGGPVVRCQPLRWSSWDPDRVLTRGTT